MNAALPMYDLPCLQESNNRFWSAIADALPAGGMDDVPQSLTRTVDLPSLWPDGTLLLGQTCGLPMTTALKGKVRFVATPHYRAPGCEGPYHHAAILVRSDDPAQSLLDLRAARAGVDEMTSNTGMNLFRLAVARVAGASRYFQAVMMTGSHAASVQAIFDRRVDVACVDCVTLALLQDHNPSLMRVSAFSNGPMPCLLYLSSRQWIRPADILRLMQETLVAVCADPTLERLRHVLRIESVSMMHEDDYGSIIHVQN